MYLQGKGTIGVRKNEPEKKVSSDTSANGCTVTVNGKKYAVQLDGAKATVNGKSYDVAVSAGIEQTASAPSGDGEPIKAALPGVVIRTEVNAGDEVAEGDVLLVVEAMKMETEIKSPKAGKVLSVDVSQGDQVQNGQTLVVLG